MIQQTIERTFFKQNRHKLTNRSSHRMEIVEGDTVKIISIVRLDTLNKRTVTTLCQVPNAFVFQNSDGYET